MSQKHDQGWKKRQHAAHRAHADKDSTEYLAAELVRKHLASHLILERGQTAPKNRRER